MGSVLDSQRQSPTSGTRCQFCRRETAFGRLHPKRPSTDRCALCDAKVRLSTLPQFDAQAVLSTKRGQELATMYQGMPKQERFRFAAPYGVHYLLTHCFAVDPWEVYAELIYEYKVYIRVGRLPKIYLRPVQRTAPRFAHGSFEGKRM